MCNLIIDQYLIFDSCFCGIFKGIKEIRKLKLQCYWCLVRKGEKIHKEENKGTLGMQQQAVL